MINVIVSPLCPSAVTPGSYVPPSVDKMTAAVLSGSGHPVALELEHALGFTPLLQGLAVYPNPSGFHDAAHIAYGCGQLVIINNLNDRHEQRLLRGHDAPVTCLDISAKGSFIASGQRASVDRSVPFVIWDFATGQPTQRVLTTHQGHVDVVRYSPDEGMIATTGAEGSLCVWDAITGTKVASFQDTVSGDAARSVCWGPVEHSGTRNQKYTLYVAFSTGVRFFTLQFSVKTLSFQMQSVTCQVPGAGGRMGGFVRKYLCSGKTAHGDMVCGTTSGDVVVFSCASATYRTALTLCANGVVGLCVVHKYDCVIIGGGDGVIQKIAGKGDQWSVLQKTRVQGHVCTMSCSADEEEVYIMTDAGHIYRMLCRDMTLCLASEAPLSGLTDVSIPSDRTDWFASASKDGVVRVWDLSEYSIVCQFTVASSAVGQPAPIGSMKHTPSMNGNAAASRMTGSAVSDAPTPTSVAFDTPSSVICSGWSDGRIRGLQIVPGNPWAQLLWTIPNAHKGRVHSLRASKLYYLSAGDDSSLRVWSRNRDLVAQTQDHKQPVVACLIDNTSDTIVHSVSLDMSLASYDLTKEDMAVSAPRRIAFKSDVQAGAFTCLAQRRDHERECVVGTQEGSILFFDIDAERPVMRISDAQRSKITALEVSPNGRWLVGGLSDGSIVVYELFADSGNRCQLVLQALCHSAGVARCAWTADGRQVVSAGNDGELIIWNFYDASETLDASSQQRVVPAAAEGGTAKASLEKSASVTRR